MPVSQNSPNHSRPGISSSSSSSSEADSGLSLPTPPDGGWGWVVVFASFMVHLIADGCAFSFGVLYVELLHYFKESKGKTAWVGSLFVSVPLITGPIASALTNKYGCRTVTITGSVIAGFGFILSSFMDSIEKLCFTFGIIAGFGLSMVYVPAVVVVAYYFEKKRAFATGIAVAGSGIGTFVFAPLTECLIEWYTWKGAVLIMGGIMLNIIVCGAVFRPLVSAETRKHNAASKQLSLESRLSRKNSRSGHDDYKFSEGNPIGMHPLLLREAEIEELLQEPVAHSLVQFPTYLQKELQGVSPDILRNLGKNGKTFYVLMHEPDFIEKHYATQSLTDMSCLTENGNRILATETAGGSSQDGAPQVLPPGDHATGPSNVIHQQVVSRDCGDAGGNHVNMANGHARRRMLQRELVWQKQTRTHHLSLGRGRLADQSWPMQRKDIFYRGSLVRPGLAHPPGRAASCPDIVMHSQRSSSDDMAGRIGLLRLLRFSHEVKHVLKEMMDIAILRSVVFVYFCLSSMLLYMWYDVPYVYTPDKAIKMGISEEMASFLVSIIGIVSTFGQIVMGYIGDHPRVNTLHFYNTLISIAGICTMLVPLITNYAGLATFAGAYGFFISGNYALTTIILVDLLGMEKLTNAYGLVMLAEGLSNLIGPPLAGKRNLFDYLIQGFLPFD